MKKLSFLPLFAGADFACSPLHAIDSDEALRGLLSFLCLQPGDTDTSYFDGYDAAQRAWAETDAERVAADLGVYDGDGEPLNLSDLDL